MTSAEFPNPTGDQTPAAYLALSEASQAAFDGQALTFAVAVRNNNESGAMLHKELANQILDTDSDEGRPALQAWQALGQSDTEPPKPDAEPDWFNGLIVSSAINELVANIVERGTVRITALEYLYQCRAHDFERTKLPELEIPAFRATLIAQLARKVYEKEQQRAAATQIPEKPSAASEQVLQEPEEPDGLVWPILDEDDFPPLNSLEKFAELDANTQAAVDDQLLHAAYEMRQNPRRVDIFQRVERTAGSVLSDNDILDLSIDWMAVEDRYAQVNEPELPACLADTPDENLSVINDQISELVSGIINETSRPEMLRDLYNKLDRFYGKVEEWRPWLIAKIAAGIAKHEQESPVIEGEIVEEEAVAPNGPLKNILLVAQGNGTVVGAAVDRKLEGRIRSEKLRRRICLAIGGVTVAAMVVVTAAVAIHNAKHGNAPIAGAGPRGSSSPRGLGGGMSSSAVHTTTSTAEMTTTTSTGISPTSTTEAVTTTTTTPNTSSSVSSAAQSSVTPTPSSSSSVAETTTTTTSSPSTGPSTGNVPPHTVDQQPPTGSGVPSPDQTGSPQAHIPETPTASGANTAHQVTVQAGDNVYKIGAREGLTQTQIANGLQNHTIQVFDTHGHLVADPNHIRPGYHVQFGTHLQEAANHAAAAADTVSLHQGGNLSHSMQDVLQQSGVPVNGPSVHAATEALFTYNQSLGVPLNWDSAHDVQSQIVNNRPIALLNGQPIHMPPPDVLKQLMEELESTK